MQGTPKAHTAATRVHVQTPNDLLAKIDRLAELEHGTRTGVILRLVSRAVDVELAAWPGDDGRDAVRRQFDDHAVATFDADPAEMTIEEAQDRLRRSRERAGLDAATGLPMGRGGRGIEPAGQIAERVTSGERRLDPGEFAGDDNENR